MIQPPRSAYIHVPFCSQRCGYCNFTLITGRDDLIGQYLQALQREMDAALPCKTEVDTIFLGGGTPSYLHGRQLEHLLQIVGDRLSLSYSGEYTCEVNPLDCTADRLQQLAAAGVNRISLGGQSFDDAKLQLLQRDHRRDDLLDAIERCRSHFPAVSLDLIFAAPGESVRCWDSDLRLAVRSEVGHLSTYGLTVERGAAFYGRVLRGELTELSEELQLRLYTMAIQQLCNQGWEHYEVSSFARPGNRCRHNEVYWRGQPWWAFGPGAASFLPDVDQQMVRSVNHRSTTTYIRRILSGKSPVQQREVLSREQQLRERLVFGLRLIEGIDLQMLEKWYQGPVLACFEPYLSRYIKEGWLKNENGRLRLTTAGLYISDCLWPDLLSS